MSTSTVFSTSTTSRPRGGDRLLQAFATRLLGSVRSSDTVSRQGGDEFVILLCEVAHSRDAAVTAEKILAALCEPYRIDQLELHVSASIGIATYPADGSTVDALLKNADAAMYQAKQCGRNNYQFFKAAMNQDASERHTLSPIFVMLSSGASSCCITNPK